MINEEEAALARQWGEAESRLVKRVDWAKLSKRARRVLPAARPLFRVEAALRAIEKRRARTLKQLVRTPAATTSEILAKLRVLAGMVKAFDQPMASALLQATVADLEGLGG